MTGHCMSGEWRFAGALAAVLEFRLLKLKLYICRAVTAWALSVYVVLHICPSQASAPTCEMKWMT